MARFYYDRQGRLTGSSKSSADIAREQEAAAGLAVLLLVLTPFAPILLGGYRSYLLLLGVGWHPLFAGAAGVLIVCAAGWLLISSRLVRLLYFGAETVAATVVVFMMVSRGSDAIWGGFAALLVLLVGGAITRWLCRLPTP